MHQKRALQKLFSDENDLFLKKKEKEQGRDEDVFFERKNSSQERKMFFSFSLNFILKNKRFLATFCFMKYFCFENLL